MFCLATLESLVISRRHKFIFVHIPKTGGNSVSRALLPFTESHLEEAASPAGFGSGENFWTVDREFGRDKHFTADRYVELMDIRDFFIFATVRNPFDWAVSMYCFRKQTCAGVPHPWVSEEPDIFGKAEFLRFLHSREPSQSSFLGRAQVPVHLLRFETLGDDFRTLCRRLRLGDLVLEKINSSRRPIYEDVLDAELEFEISKLYAVDFQRFGYPRTIKRP